MSEYDRSYYEDGTKCGYKGYTWERLRSMFEPTAKHIVTTFHPQRLLDCGCAKGFLVKSVCDLGVTAEGCDISKYAISQSPVPTRVRVADITDLPYEDRSFDVVTCLDTLEHLDHPEEAIGELRRVSSKWILIHVWTEEAPDFFDVTHRRPPKKYGEWVKMMVNDEWEAVDIKPYMGNVSWFRCKEMVIILRRIEK